MKDSVHPFFVGYSDLALMRPALSRERPVFVLETIDPGKPTSSGLRLDRLQVVVSQPDPDNSMAHYCLLVVATEQMVGNAPLDAASYHKHEAEAGQIAGLITGWLEAKGYTVVRGLMAMPGGVRYMDGWWGALEYDAASQAYRLKPGEEDAPAPDTVIE